MFWLKKEKSVVNSREYESLCKKLIEISTHIEEIELKLKILSTNYDNLRGQFNRKLTGLKTEEEKKTENINTPVILPHNGDFQSFI